MNLKKLTDIPFIFSTLHSNAQYRERERERERESNYRIHLENLSCNSMFFKIKISAIQMLQKIRFKFQLLRLFLMKFVLLVFLENKSFTKLAITEKKLIRDQKYRN